MKFQLAVELLTTAEIIYQGVSQLSTGAYILHFADQRDGTFNQEPLTHIPAAIHTVGLHNFLQEKYLEHMKPYTLPTHPIFKSTTPPSHPLNTGPKNKQTTPPSKKTSTTTRTRINYPDHITSKADRKKYRRQLRKQKQQNS